MAPEYWWRSAVVQATRLVPARTLLQRAGHSRVKARRGRPPVWSLGLRGTAASTSLVSLLGRESGMAMEYHWIVRCFRWCEVVAVTATRMADWRRRLVGVAVATMSMWMWWWWWDTMRLMVEHGPAL